MTERAGGTHPGKLIAAALAGSWRNSPPAFEGTAADLATVVPLLLGSGAGALGWWRIRKSGLRDTSAALQLKEAYRMQTLLAALHEMDIARAVTLLRSAGVEPILFKGWAAAGLYPEKGLRPCGDIDLLVSQEQHAAAESMLQSAEGKRFWIDLQPHAEINELDDQSFDRLYARSELVKSGKVDIRVPGPEDHLRLLCVHLLKHGAHRPLWLCDIAAAVESRPAGFDWDRFIGADTRRAGWVTSAIGMAHHLLGVRVEDTPLAAKVKKLPGWLVPSVLKAWKTPCTIEHRGPEHIMASLRSPTHIPMAFAKRWRHPMEATVEMHWSFNGLPRLPFQIANYSIRALRMLIRLPRLAREQP